MMISKIKNSSLNNYLKSGLQAVKNSDKRNIILSNRKNLEGSIDIDSNFKENYPNDNRWDYLILNNSDIEGYFVEIHPAHTSEVKVMIKKREWLQNRIYFTPKVKTKIEIF